LPSEDRKRTKATTAKTTSNMFIGSNGFPILIFLFFKPCYTIW
jgi:hypothetical protein